MFSLLGAVYFAALFVPNVAWARSHPPAPGPESRGLVALERIGQVATTLAAIFAPIVAPARPPAGALELACLALSLVALAGYEVAWLRYFRGPRDLYRALAGIPIPLATLPIAAFALLAVYERHVVLLASVTLLGIGHITLHARHAREVHVERNAPRIAATSGNDR